MLHTATSLTNKISLAELPKTCEEAVEVGSKTYFTNSLCKHKHLAPRYIASGRCIECQRKGVRVFYNKNKDDANYLKSRNLLARRRQDREGRKKVEVTEEFSGRVFPSVKEAAEHFSISPASAWRSIYTEMPCGKRGSSEKFMFKKKAFLAYGEGSRNQKRFNSQNKKITKT
jgi:hypothetical protein